MNKLKDILPNVFGGSSKDKQKSETNGKIETTKTKKTQKQETTEIVGRLETDAAPVYANDDINRNYVVQTSVNNTPTASTEMTEAVVRELSDPSYNSLELAENATSGQLAHVANDLNMLTPNTNTMNTMNVNSAQQQVVMQISNVQKLHFGHVYNVGAGGGGGGGGNSYSKSANSSRKSSNCSTNSETPLKTTTIVQMMQSQEEPTYRMLDTVSTHLGSNYKQVMRELGISDGQIEQAIIDHTNCGGTKEVIHQLLLLWLRSADDGEGTLGRLTCVLWEKNSRECVQRMKLVYKAENTRKPRTEVK